MSAPAPETPAWCGPRTYRFYVGIHEGMRLTMRLGPGKFDGIGDPVRMGELDMYPVGEAVWRDWSGEDDDQEEGDACPVGHYTPHRRGADPNACVECREFASGRRP